jgi:hypothetical protein
MEVVAIGIDVGQRGVAFATADFVVECLEGKLAATARFEEEMERNCFLMIVAAVNSRDCKDFAKCLQNYGCKEKRNRWTWEKLGMADRALSLGSIFHAYCSTLYDLKLDVSTAPPKSRKPVDL